MFQRLLDLELVAKLRRSKGGSECSDPIGKRNVRRNNRLKPMQANRSRRVLSNGPLMNPADSETGTHLLGKKMAFPQVVPNTPHVGKQYSPYRPEGPKTRLELTPPRWSGKTAGKNAILPMSGKILPIGEFQLELTQLSSR